jgi:hypothetical protein
VTLLLAQRLIHVSKSNVLLAGFAFCCTQQEGRRRWEFLAANIRRFLHQLGQKSIVYRDWVSKKSSGLQPWLGDFFVGCAISLDPGRLCLFPLVNFLHNQAKDIIKTRCRTKAFLRADHQLQQQVLEFLC